MEQKLPLLVIAGPTASGKTACAVALAKMIGGEIVIPVLPEQEPSEDGPAAPAEEPAA